MTLKDWVDLFTGGGAAISAIAAGVAAWAARTSARAAKESSEATRAAIRSSELIADNDRRIRLMEERMKVWRTYDNLLLNLVLWGHIEWEELAEATAQFQLAPFLLPSEVSDYLQIFTDKLRHHTELWEKLNQSTADNLINATTTAEREDWQARFDDILQWLNKQQSEGQNIFKKHMSLID